MSFWTLILFPVFIDGCTFSVCLCVLYTPVDDAVFVKLPHCAPCVVVLAGSLTSVLGSSLNSYFPLHSSWWVNFWNEVGNTWVHFRLTRAVSTRVCREGQCLNRGLSQDSALPANSWHMEQLQPDVTHQGLNCNCWFGCSRVWLQQWGMALASLSVWTGMLGCSSTSVRSWMEISSIFLMK